MRLATPHVRLPEPKILSLPAAGFAEGEGSASETGEEVKERRGKKQREKRGAINFVSVRY